MLEIPSIADIILGKPQKKVKTKRRRRRFSRTIEKRIYEKYKHRCAICGKITAFDEGEIDHIKPLSKGGTDHPRNLQWLCHRCNKLKGNRLTNDEVRELLGLKPKKEKKRSTKKRKTRSRQKSFEKSLFDILI